MPHVTEDNCERYALQQLTGAALEQHEEHLLICEACLRPQAEADEFVQAMKRTLSDQSEGERPWKQNLLFLGTPSPREAFASDFLHVSTLSCSGDRQAQVGEERCQGLFMSRKKAC